MQMAAVVKLASPGMRLQVWHQSGQMGWINVIEAELLKARRVDHCRCALPVQPVPGGAGGGVFAGVKCPGNLRGLRQRTRFEPIDERAFARTRGPKQQCSFARHQAQQCRLVSRAGGFERHWKHRVAHAPVRFEPVPSPGK